jgi:cellulose/xylan binding protein with CBM9 domain
MTNRISRVFLGTIFGIFMLTSCRYTSPTSEDINLAEKTQRLAEAAENTPGRHVGYYFTENYFGRKAIKRLKGENKATSEQLEGARRGIAKKMDALELGPAWPEPISVKIPYAVTLPKIDGNIDEAAWNNALTFEGAYPMGKTEKRSDLDITWKIMWDQNCIYFAIKCADSDIIAPKLERDGRVFLYDSFEIFVMTDKAMGGYWELVISPLDTIFDSLQTANRTAWRRISRNHRNMKGFKTGIKINGSANHSSDIDNSFTIEAALPFSEMPGYMKGNKPKHGDEISFMLVKTDISESNKNVKYYAIQPLLCTCHNTWNYINATLKKNK